MQYSMALRMSCIDSIAEQAAGAISHRPFFETITHSALLVRLWENVAAKESPAMLLAHSHGQDNTECHCIAVQLLLGCKAFHATALQTCKGLMYLSLGTAPVSRCGQRHDGLLGSVEVTLTCMQGKKQHL